MCNCKNVEVGTYANQIKLAAPKHMLPLTNCIGEVKEPFICIDKCLEDEIKSLWSKGIHTIGCCCGHNVRCGYIQVDGLDAEKMVELGYKCDVDCWNSFSPKTV